jgi:hypothetical protein
LEFPINRFESFECVEQLHSDLSHRIGFWAVLFGLPDRETDSLDGDPNLVGHFELDG